MVVAEALVQVVLPVGWLVVRPLVVRLAEYFVRLFVE
jgi:hypothetical protein